MSSSDIVQLIVTKLNQEPFKKGLTLVSFDKKSPQELLQILQDVLAEISPEQKVDLRDEPSEFTSQRMFDFLWILKYKIPVADSSIFKNGLTQGERNIIHPVLYWILPRIPELRKRAYLARFLMPFDVPPEMQDDEANLEYKHKQNEFKDIHKLLDKIHSSGLNPTEIKIQYANLEEQKQRLVDQLDRLKKKLERVPNVPSLLEAVELLRKERDEENQLSENQKELQQEAQKADKQLEEERLKNKELQTFEGGIEEHINHLEEELKTSKFINDKFPTDIQEKKQWRDKLRSVLNQPILSDSERAKLQSQIQQLKSDIKKLIQKRDSSANKVDDELAIYRQKNAAVEKKKEAKSNSLRDILEEYSSLEKELKAQQEKLEEVSPANLLKGEALDKYVQDLRKKTILFKKCRSDQVRVSTEIGILRRTLEILQAQETTLKETVSQIEEEKGVKGYQETQEKIEIISEQKSSIDEEKGKTLEEISKVVAEIQQSIKEQKTRLAPQVKELRQVRSQYQELEAQYKEKKALYDNSILGIQSEKERLQQERFTFDEEAQRQESKFFSLICTSKAIDALIAKAAVVTNSPSESEGKSSKESFKDLYSRATQEQEILSKSLREQQKQIKETHEPNLLQMEMFSDLKKILQAKLKGSFTSDLSSQNEEVDRLVL